MIPANMIPVNAIFDSDLHRRTEGTSSASRLIKSGEYIYQTINGEKAVTAMMNTLIQIFIFFLNRETRCYAQLSYLP